MSNNVWYPFALIMLFRSRVLNQNSLMEMSLFAMCDGFLQMGIRLLRGVWVPWFYVLFLRPRPLTPTEGHLWHAMGRVQTVGQAGDKLSPPWLYCLREFREGTLTWLSHRVQSFICVRQGPLAPQGLPFWTLKIRTLGMAADKYTQVRRGMLLHSMYMMQHKESVHILYWY